MLESTQLILQQLISPPNNYSEGSLWIKGKRKHDRSAASADITFNFKIKSPAEASKESGRINIYILRFARAKQIDIKHNFKKLSKRENKNKLQLKSNIRSIIYALY